MQSDWYDIRFTSGSCGSDGAVELDYEFVENDSVAGEFWVRIPTLTAGTNSICMYYNNSIASSGENATGVWSSNYLLVAHMRDNDTSSINDSTSRNNDGTKRIHYLKNPNPDKPKKTNTNRNSQIISNDQKHKFKTKR